MLLEKTKEELLSIIIENIKNTTGIKNVSPASFIYKLSNAIAEYSYEIQDIWNEAFVNSLLQYASGRYLDLIGNSMGLYRKQEDYARIYAADKIFCFYVDYGTFGDINNGNSIIIQANTSIYSDYMPDGSRYEFIITNDLVLDANTNKHYFAAEAVSSGEITLAENSIVEHSFSSYTDYVNNTLKVTNEKPFTAGQYQESDSDFRYRIYNALSHLAKGNNIAITLEAMSVPGVSDVKIIDFERGAGSTSVYVVPTHPEPDENLVNLVSMKLENVKSLGTDLRVYNPVFLGIELEVTLIFKDSVPIHDRPLIRQQVKQNLIDYINNVQIGEPLMIQQLHNVILNTDSGILRTGNSDMPFDIFNVYKDTSYFGRVAQYVSGDIYSKPYEKIVCEYTLSDPIRVK